MGDRDNTVFFQWLKKSNITEQDVIGCRKMQSMAITEDTNAFGISTISISGFENNDFVKLGEAIKQHYSETPEAYAKRVYDIYMTCAELMDSVNSILKDEGSWSSDYFQTKINTWYESKK